ncbi:hypothetical protein O6H91_Y353400 [Diphasiastrum complanatum]|nr:hypothetical protein O6H91_Y353400 [Diphasiastrum complanatum]
MPSGTALRNRHVRSHALPCSQAPVHVAEPYFSTPHHILTNTALSSWFTRSCPWNREACAYGHMIFQLRQREVFLMRQRYMFSLAFVPNEIWLHNPDDVVLVVMEQPCLVLDVQYQDQVADISLVETTLCFLQFCQRHVVCVPLSVAPLQVEILEQDLDTAELPGNCNTHDVSDVANIIHFKKLCWTT